MRCLIGKREVGELTGYHPEHVMRLARQGKFPQPIKLGDDENCAVRFVIDEIEAWIAERMAARGQGGGTGRA
jgi:predicted DNA-binding transcriptional regulator AlpA